MTDITSLPKMQIDSKHTLAEVEEIYRRVTKSDYGHTAISKMQNVISILNTMKTLVEKYRTIDTDMSKCLKSFEYGAISQMLSGINLYLGVFTPSMSELRVLMNNADVKIQQEMSANPNIKTLGYNTIIPHVEIAAIIEPLKENCVKVINCLVQENDFMQVAHYFRNDINEILPNIPLGNKKCLVPSLEGLKVKNVSEFNSREAFHVYSGFSLYTKQGSSVADMFQVPIAAVVNNMHIAAERLDNGVAMPFVIKQDIACLITAFWHFIYSVMSLLESIDPSGIDIMLVPRVTLTMFKSKYPMLGDHFKTYLASGVEDIPQEKINIKNIVVELMGSSFKSSYVQYLELCKQSMSTDNFLSNIKNAASSSAIMDQLAPLRNYSGLGKILESQFLNEDNIKGLLSNGLSLESFTNVIDALNKK